MTQTIRTIKGVSYLVSGTPDLLFYRKAGAKYAYRVTPAGCSCPATQTCKHMEDAKEVRSDMVMDEIRAIVNEPIVFRRMW